MAEHTSTSYLLLEQWKPVVGYEGIYSVSNCARIRRDKFWWNTKVGRIMKEIPTHKGYMRVHLSKGNRGRFVHVHMLVAEAFIGPRPNGLQLNHKDSNKKNNRPDNLEYVTASENKCHATRAGHHGMTKLTCETVREIRHLIATGITQYEIGRRFGVGQDQISRIKNRKRWGHLV